MLVWVVGSGGMLGSAIAMHARRAQAQLFDARPVPWADVDAATRVLTEDATVFADHAGDQPWAVLWAAGASVVASDEQQTAAELHHLEAVAAVLARHRPPGPGALFVTSSAGGLYAGSAAPPFDVRTPIHPISPYGRLKQAQEEAACRIVGDAVPVVLGRFSNLYGPGHRPGKQQGLIPLLCRAALQRRPLNLYVSMDTVRDYLYVDDAASMAWQTTVSSLGTTGAVPRTEILASGQPATVAEVIATVQNVAHRRVPLALGTDASARHQATDLRLVPTVTVDGLTPLPNGVKRVFDAIVGRAA